MRTFCRACERVRVCQGIGLSGTRENVLVRVCACEEESKRRGASTWSTLSRKFSSSLNHVAGWRKILARVSISRRAAHASSIPVPLSFARLSMASDVDICCTRSMRFCMTCSMVGVVKLTVKAISAMIVAPSIRDRRISMPVRGAKSTCSRSHARCERPPFDHERPLSDGTPRPHSRPWRWAGGRPGRSPRGDGGLHGEHARGRGERGKGAS